MRTLVAIALGLMLLTPVAAAERSGATNDAAGSAAFGSRDAESAVAAYNAALSSMWRLEDSAVTQCLEVAAISRRRGDHQSEAEMYYFAAKLVMLRGDTSLARQYYELSEQALMDDTTIASPWVDRRSIRTMGLNQLSLTQSVRSGLFTFYFADGTLDSVTLDRILATAASLHQEYDSAVIPNFDVVRARDNIVIYIVPPEYVGHFIKATSLQTFFRELAFAYRGEGSLGNLRHEMAHLFEGYLFFNHGTIVNRTFLREGLAERFTPPACGLPLHIWAKHFSDSARFSESKVLSLLVSDHAFRNESKFLSYRIAGSFVTWCLETFGPEKFKAYFAASDSPEAVFHLSSHDLVRRWIQFLDNLPPLSEKQIAILNHTERWVAASEAVDSSVVRAMVAMHARNENRNPYGATFYSEWFYPDEIIIGRVYPNTAAASSGLTCGDIVTHVDGKAISVENIGALLARLYSTNGDFVTLTLSRGPTVTLRGGDETGEINAAR